MFVCDVATLRSDFGAFLFNSCRISPFNWLILTDDPASQNRHWSSDMVCQLWYRRCGPAVGYLPRLSPPVSICGSSPRYEITISTAEVQTKAYFTSCKVALH